MKNHFYASLLIGISLIIASVPCLAKKPQAAAKSASKPASPKPVANKKSAESATKKSTVVVATKQTKNHQSDNNAKDNKHDSSKSHQIASSKNSRHEHDKLKSHQFADAKDHKNGKRSSRQLADKDSKHGKSKLHQLAYAKDYKHGRKRSHQVAEDTSVDENEEAVAESDEQTQASTEQAPEEVLSNTETGSVKNSGISSELASAPPKSSRLFFQPLDKSTNETLSEGRPKASGFTFSDSKDNSRISSTLSNAKQPDAVAEANDNEEENPLPPSASGSNDRIPPSTNTERIHSSISRGNLNSIVEHAGDQEVSNQVASAHGVVEASLDSAGAKAGLSSDMIVELTEIFAWDVDFANNLQSGDQFTVIYEAGNGKAHNKIIAAEFVNLGKTYTAIRYKDKDGMTGYYNRGGQSVRKAFLTTPVDFIKVSSPFSTHRHHPILNRIRAHKGVDYAARTGTPVKAAGDGVVTFHGTQGGYGRMIVISHGEHYETAYAHLSNYRSNLQDGEHVKQGQIIGYVGQSGLATGPHLHYEFRVDGVHQDPEQLDRKQGTLLTGNDWQNFKNQTLPILTQLNTAKANSLFAANKPPLGND